MINLQIQFGHTVYTWQKASSDKIAKGTSVTVWRETKTVAGEVEYERDEPFWNRKEVTDRMKETVDKLMRVKYA